MFKLVGVVVSAVAVTDAIASLAAVPPADIAAPGRYCRCECVAAVNSH